MGTYTFKVTALKVAAWALIGLFLPAAVWAAGLGKLTVLSALGQPLRAEIEISSVAPGEADSLSVRLASFETYRQAGVERSVAASSIQFAVDRRASGQHVVVLSSVESVNEPFLDLLVDLSWEGGHLVREYTFLLDPPEYKAPVAQAPVSPTEPATPAAPEARPEPAAPPAVSPAVVERTLEPVAKPAVSYKMQRGDTLTKVALEHSQEGVSLQRMLAALYRANQGEFDASNMNRIRAGKVLTIPDRETIEAVTQSEAQSMIVKQNAEFDEYRRQIGMAIAKGPAREGAGRQVSGRIGEPTVEKQPPSKEPAKDQLRLSKAGDVKTGGAGGAAARADDLAAKEKALKEANERIAMLEKNVRDLQKLVELKSETGATLQQAAKGAAAKAPPAAPPSAAAPPTTGGPVAAKPAAAGKAEQPVKAPEPPKAAPPAPKPKPIGVRKAPPRPPPPPEPSFMDEMLGDPVALGAGGGVVVLLALYAGYAWRKKRKLQAEASSMEPMVAVEAPTVFGAAATAQQIDADSATLQGELRQGAIGKPEEEIDPIAEADVYMAYGRDAQAEEILKEALGKEPGRHEIRAKLLEIYANRKDLKAFAATATELSAATGGHGPAWEKAVTLGLSIDPHNPLYGGTPAEAAGGMGDTTVMTPAVLAGAGAAHETVADEAAQAAPPLDFDLDLGAGGEAPAPKPEVAGAAEESLSGLDFDLGTGDEGAAETKGAAPAPPPAAAAEAPAEEGMSIDFDLGTPGAAAEPAPEPAKDGGLTMDFDLGAPVEAGPAQEKAPALDLSSISLDLDVSPGGASGGAVPDAHWQEVATKLDLAKAYEEMGDKDGARELLNEVAAEGDAAQQQQAKTMLAALA